MSLKSQIKVPAAEVEAHFRKLAAPAVQGLFDDDFQSYAKAVLLSFEPGPTVPILDSLLTSQEIKSAIEQMKNSSPGEDRIGKDDLMSLDPEDIATFFLQVTESVCVPASWSRSLLVQIPKPGKCSNIASNLRGISLQQSLRKLFMLCLVPRIYSWSQSINLIQYYQIGFRPGYRTTDNIFILRALHERSVFEGHILFVVFIDLQTAFDLTDRTLLWAYLREKGAEGRLIEILKEMHRRPTTSIRLNGLFSEFCDVVFGVLQGDPMSPLLFIIFLSALELANNTREDDPMLNGV